MPLGTGKLDKLHTLVKRHMNWFIASVLGEDALSPEDRKDLKKFKSLPKQSLDFVKNSFLLGRLKAIFKAKEWKGVTWEDFVKFSKSQRLSPLEQLVLQQAKLRAAQHLKGLTSDIAAGVFSQLSKMTNQAVSEASIKQIIRDEVELALIEKKSYQELASSLASRTKTAHGRAWKKIARTELHTAKMHGLAQAIINKVDVYKHSDGIKSNVSIVPRPGTCTDCAHHYLDKAGNPKVFPLSQLMGAGSNADPGVSHTRRNGLHHKWKTTLPPLHPECGCSLVFIPPGYSWVNGVLKLTNKAALKKAIGDSALSAVNKPKGPPSAQSSAPANPPTIPGVKSPAQANNGGRPANEEVTWSSDEVDYVSKKKHPKPPENSLGESSTKASWVVPKGSAPGKGESDEGETDEAPQEEESSQTPQDSIAYGLANRPHAEVLNHLKSGKFNEVKPLSAAEAGQSGVTSARVQVDGNGRGLLKAVATTMARGTVREGTDMLAGEGTTVPGTGPQREEAAYQVSMLFGLTDHVPPTTVRTHDGVTHSIQSWAEDFSPTVDALTDSLSSQELPEAELVLKKNEVKSNVIKAILDRCPEDKKEALVQKLSEGVSLHIIQNAGDAHHGNMLTSKDFSDVRFIDNAASFGHSMQGTSSEIHYDLHRLGIKVKVPAALMDRYSNTSYGDVKRATSGLDPRESAQTFLRMRYAQHLMESEGYLDYNKFKPVMTDDDGELFPRPGFWPGKPREAQEAFEAARRSEKLPHEQFNKFVKSYVASAGFDDHHDYESVRAILADTSLEELTLSPEWFYAKHVKTAAEKMTSSPQHPAAQAAELAEAARSSQEAPPEAPPAADDGLAESVVAGPAARRRAARRRNLNKSLYISNPCQKWS